MPTTEQPSLSRSTTFHKPAHSRASTTPTWSTSNSSRVAKPASLRCSTPKRSLVLARFVPCERPTSTCFVRSTDHCSPTRAETRAPPRQSTIHHWSTLATQRPLAERTSETTAARLRITCSARPLRFARPVAPLVAFRQHCSPSADQAHQTRTSRQMLRAFRFPTKTPTSATPGTVQAGLGHKMAEQP